MLPNRYWDVPGPSDFSQRVNSPKSRSQCIDILSVKVSTRIPAHLSQVARWPSRSSFLRLIHHCHEKRFAHLAKNETARCILPGMSNSKHAASSTYAQALNAIEAAHIAPPLPNMLKRKSSASVIRLGRAGTLAPPNGRRKCPRKISSDKRVYYFPKSVATTSVMPGFARRRKNPPDISRLHVSTLAIGFSLQPDDLFRQIVNPMGEYWVNLALYKTQIDASSIRNQTVVGACSTVVISSLY